MEKENGNDLLLAKRRIIAIFPFLLLNFSFSVTMIVFSSILYYRVNSMRDDYIIEYDDYQYESSDECNIISRKIKSNKKFFSNFQYCQSE